MKDDRLRVALDDPFALALGRTIYCFAICEWAAIYCCHRMAPTFLDKVVNNPYANSGWISEQLTNLTRNLPRIKGRNEAKRLATRFEELVKKRNSLVHAKPGTVPRGAQRLFSWADGVIEISNLEDVADEFVACAEALDQLRVELLDAYSTRTFGVPGLPPVT